MEAFHWDECFVTGIATVDAEHHGLVELINQLGDAVTGEGGASRDDVERVFERLAAYAVRHFTDEEAMMASRGLDRRHLDAHRAAHASFLEEVTVMHATLPTGDPQAADALLKFLSQWLAYHILGQDQVMARQIALIAEGRTPEQAYLSIDRARDPATDTLLRALDGLFHQVFERNRALSVLNRTLEARVDERTRALSEANRQLEALAMTDILTGLPNRRHAMSRIEREWRDAAAADAPLACLMIDADGFKGINDTYGHDAGDAVLRGLARELGHGVRTDDVVCRLGGDEFLIVCPRTPLAGALQLGEAVRAAVAALRVPAGAGEWRGSVSVGVAARTREMTSADDLIKAADQGVYAAKRDGRDRVATVQPR